MIHFCVKGGKEKRPSRVNKGLGSFWWNRQKCRKCAAKVFIKKQITP